jgi:aryl-alcohol dehydrogenase-like predicted oxidoreductase
MGMGVNPDPRGYNARNLSAFTERSLRNLGVETIDLMQLHCPPLAAYNPETFGILDDLVRQGKILHYGVSVERLAEARAAIQFPGVQSVMIVFNLFRQSPVEDLFQEAFQRKVGIIARVPMASGLLTGKMTRTTRFAQDDHRSFNRQGAAFDKGETFSGVDYEKGLQAVEELRPLVPAGMTMAQLALRWILMHPAVSCAVPGAKRPAQVEETLAAADLPALSPDIMQKIKAIYDLRIRPDVRNLW